MRTALILSLVLGAASPALANDPAKPAETKPATQPASAPAGDSPTASPAMPPAPPAPSGIPVPDMPIVNKSEIEGIIIEDMKIGEGYEVRPGGSVVAHYHGTLKADPTKIFDSSFQRGEPVAFPLSGVIAGWQKGVPGMKLGGIRKLTIPAKLAYGERSPSPNIPANSDLVFVIQLVDAIQVEDVKVGEGDMAALQNVAVANYVIKDKDGKELEKNPDGKPYIWFPGENQGLSVGLEGMKVGGKRIIKLPAQFNQNNPGIPEAASRKSNVPCIIEVELVNLRNLPTGPGGGR